MQTARKRISSVENDSKQRRQTVSSDRFQKLGHRSDDNAPSTSSRDGKREGEHRFKRLMSSNERAKHFQTRNNMASNGDGSRKMTMTSDKFMQIIQKTGGSQRNSKAMSMSVAASNKANILDLLQDINSVDIGVSFLPFYCTSINLNLRWIKFHWNAMNIRHDIHFTRVISIELNHYKFNHKVVLLEHSWIYRSPHRVDY